MDNCKANKCTTNSSLIYESIRSKLNDFDVRKKLMNHYHIIDY